MHAPLSCCARTPRQTVYEYLDRGLRTRRQTPLPLAPKTSIRLGDLQASFSFRLHRAHLHEIRFEATACMTLVAYCQALLELAHGQPVAQLRHHTSRQWLTRLLNQVQGVPVSRQDRARLAVWAFQRSLRSVYQFTPKTLPFSVRMDRADTPVS